MQRILVTYSLLLSILVTQVLGGRACCCALRAWTPASAAIGQESGSSSCCQAVLPTDLDSFAGCNGCHANDRRKSHSSYSLDRAGGCHCEMAPFLGKQELLSPTEIDLRTLYPAAPVPLYVAPSLPEPRSQGDPAPPWRERGSVSWQSSACVWRL